MKIIEASVVINHPVEAVFTAATDFESLAEWRTGLIEAAITSAGPIQVGTEYRYNLKAMGRELETRGVVEAYEPPRVYGWKATSGPFPMSGSMRCEPVEEGTRITETIAADPGGFFKLAEPLLLRQQRSQTEKDLQQLKELLEGGAR